MVGNKSEYFGKLKTLLEEYNSVFLVTYVARDNYFPPAENFTALGNLVALSLTV
jgi:hypothetical protein